MRLAGRRRGRVDLAPVRELPQRRLNVRRYVIGRALAADVCALLGVDPNRVASLSITAEQGGLWVTVEEAPQ